MISKIYINRKIEEKKKEYFENNISYSLVEAGIYKGLYKALGGKRSIALPIKFDDIATTSEKFFKIYFKIKDIEDIDEVNKIINKKLSRYNINIEVGFESIDNLKLALLFSQMVVLNYTEDIVINRDNIYKTMVELLDNDFVEDMS